MNPERALAAALRLAIPNAEVLPDRPDGLIVMVPGWPQEDEARAVVEATKRALTAAEPSIGAVRVLVVSK